jgi:putative membrane protein
MKNYFIKIIITTILIFIISKFLPITITDYVSVLFMAIILGFLNTFLKPILKILTIPVTILTLGLFLLVINAFIVNLADYFIDGLKVEGWITALLFSIVLSLGQFILNGIFVEKDK